MIITFQTIYTVSLPCSSQSTLSFLSSNTLSTNKHQPTPLCPPLIPSLLINLINKLLLPPT